MSRRIVWGLLTVALTVVWAVPADAGRRHRHRSCQTCSTSGGGGNWFHFTSGGGTYVPFASTGGGMTTVYPVSHVAYNHSDATPAVYSTPAPCRNCRW